MSLIDSAAGDGIGTNDEHNSACWTPDDEIPVGSTQEYPMLAEVAANMSSGFMLAAHELKTPIAVIKGCATTLLGSSSRWDPAMQREMLQMIDAQSDRLYDLLNTLLDVWRLDGGAQQQSSAVAVPTRQTMLRPTRRISILLGENDTRIARYVRANLEEQQYRVQTVSHGIQLLRQCDLEEPDLILLATRLADMSGIELLQRLREFSQKPVMMLCDECDEDERVQLFNLGCDDLMVKPFGMQELLARVRARLRNHHAPADTKRTIFTTGELKIDYAQHLVMLQERPVQLSRTEYKLLSTLAQNVGMVMTHELLLEKVWGPEYNREVDFIWVYISRLRRKIEIESRHPRYILTVPDVGYKLAKLADGYKTT